MNLTPNPSSSNGFSMGGVGNMCNIDFSQDVIFIPVLYGIFFTLGVPLNLLALFGLHRLIKSNNVLPVYLINLLISDLLQLLMLPLWIDYYRRGHSWLYGPTACRGMDFIFYVTIYASIMFMCAIAVERHFAIARPMKFQAMRSLKYTRWVALGIWMVVALPPSIALKSLFTTSQNSTLCIEKYPSEEGYITYRLVTLVLPFFLPLSFIVILHRKTLQALKGVVSLAQREKRQIRGLLALLVVVFVVVLGPYHLVGCVKYVGLLFHSTPCQWEKAVFLPYQVGRVLLSINSVLDPVFYIFLRGDFREAVCRYLPCLRRVRWFTSQERSSEQRERPTNSTQDSEL
ncbi:G-protein coupled receptor 4-like [Conger conger]|uniref:G-protein coupled receptor 4-like n=1 Tax=Conger conger TaxID=82655 RepID=UPI002A59A324|nr:G-protein coupled receptor 4-like [Conger conger]XP_061083674.1 G-protein coupled receptor 4-like [Conger conger]XP_061083676.1 G-protein coupled receptor 4-like [Conger conger]XP_061083677.1 G-protein coupled receptor 4-like [Conger conger]XP_061083678.1 G-protein coupled receptor 4-like [Conger conger]